MSYGDWISCVCSGLSSSQSFLTFPSFIPFVVVLFVGAADISARLLRAELSVMNQLHCFRVFNLSCQPEYQLYAAVLLPTVC